MWKDKLREVEKQGERYASACVNIGASREVIQCWAAAVRDALGIEPPQECLDILLHFNGLEWNGCIWYGVDRASFPAPPAYEVSGLIEQNEIWQEVEEQRAYLFLGESSISWYVYEPATGRYLELDNPSGTEMEEFPSCAALLEKFLEDSLS